ncbi:embryonic polarity protein dorsal-like [Sitophilus oryzae]|uniref:Embryonic polarity protein dorsal-like n=1 Tax=Sitophilus oryzae TaxID=7048 RepID=A0A6J2YKF0_SITOR|nr:embryonic polarity protein dorsal-like [Sitophilus oryzae]
MDFGVQMNKDPMHQGEIPSFTNYSQGPPNTGAHRRQAYVRILEQPASRAYRFRYQCERSPVGSIHGSIQGVSSTPQIKTYPEIQVEGYRGNALVVVSLVMKDPPYAAHPHKIVGKGCRHGVCTLTIPVDTMRVEFPHLGIQCVKKKEVESSLTQRESIRVDPFRQHFHHKYNPNLINLSAVRLCFQVILEGETGKYTEPLEPVVSDVINDKRIVSSLTIVSLSDCVGSVSGGEEDCILLCEKASKDDIEVHFFELENDRVVWSAKPDIRPTQVYKQVVIWFKSPPYKTTDVEEPVRVFLQLYRPSDRATSEPVPFELHPHNSVSGLKRKRSRFDQTDSFNGLPEHYNINNDQAQASCSLWNIPLNSASNTTIQQNPQQIGDRMELDNFQINSDDLANTLRSMPIQGGHLPVLENLF